MSTPNGVALSPAPSSPPRSPPATSTPPPPTKRKRADSNESGTSNDFPPEDVSNKFNKFQELLGNMFGALERQDTQPSILHHALSKIASSSAEPPTKRAKLSPGATRDCTIAAKAAKKEYLTLDQLDQDVDTVVSELLATFKSKGTPASASPKTTNQSEGGERKQFLESISIFKKAVRRFLEQTMKGLGEPSMNSVGKDEEYEDGERESVKQNGFKQAETGPQSGGRDIESKAVLTLFGNAQGPKQLFSSLQKPIRGMVPKAQALISGGLTSVRESGLPPGISTTTIIPSKSENGQDRKSKRKFGDVFGPPPNIPSVQPPQPSNHTVTRGSIIGWTEADGFPGTTRRGGYTTQNLSTGQWLGYDGAEASQEPSTPEVKRKQRNRALSTGETEPLMSDEAILAVEQAKFEALFRRVYSSFAPDRDDTGAIVPQEVKNRIWWHKKGQKCFEQTLCIDPALLQDQSADPNDREASARDADEERVFQEAIDNFDWEANVADAEQAPAQTPVQDLEQILKEVSNLLETLRSYQRIRSATLTTNARISNSPFSPLKSSDSLTSPSSEESEVYLAVRDRLIYLISMLPPYAVAKLNGDPDAELIISRKLTIDGSDHSGVMEADQASRLAKAAALSSATNVPAMRSGPNTAASHYTRGTPSAQPLPRSSNQPRGYFPQQQLPARSPSWSTARPQTSTTAYQTSRTTSDAARAPYSQQGYPQQNIRQQVKSPSQSTAQYYQQRPASSGYGQGAQYSQANPYSQASQPLYQQRAQSNGQVPIQTPTPNPYGRPPSPGKPQQQTSAQKYLQQQRRHTPVYNTAISNQDQQRQQYPYSASPVNGSYSSAQPNGVNGTVPLGGSGRDSPDGLAGHPSGAKRPSTGAALPYEAQYGRLNGTPSVTA